MQWLSTRLSSHWTPGRAPPHFMLKASACNLILKLGRGPPQPSDRATGRRCFQELSTETLGIKMMYQAASRGRQVGYLLLATLAVALVSAKLCDAQDTAERYHVCNGSPMPDWEYQQATQNAISLVVQLTSGPNYATKQQATVSGKTGYAGGACNGRLDIPACNRCMAVAYDRLRAWCVNSNGVYAAGARIELNDCRLRWELYSFEPMRQFEEEPTAEPDVLQLPAHTRI